MYFRRYLNNKVDALRKAKKKNYWVETFHLCHGLTFLNFNQIATDIEIT